MTYIVKVDRLSYCAFSCGQKVVESHDIMCQITDVVKILHKSDLAIAKRLHARPPHVDNEMEHGETESGHKGILACSVTAFAASKKGLRCGDELLRNHTLRTRTHRMYDHICSLKERPSLRSLD